MESPSSCESFNYSLTLVPFTLVFIHRLVIQEQAGFTGENTLRTVHLRYQYCITLSAGIFSTWHTKMLTDSSVHSLTELSTYLYIHSFIHLSFSWTHYYSFLFLIHPSIHSSSQSSGRNCWDIMFCFLFSWLIIHAYPSILWLSHLSTHFLSIYPSSTSIYICIHPSIQCLYCLSIHLSIYLSVYLFICFFIHSFFYPHNCLFFNLSIYPTLPLIHSCHLLSIHLSKHPAIPHMSISLLVYLFSYFK